MWKSSSVRDSCETWGGKLLASYSWGRRSKCRWPVRGEGEVVEFINMIFLGNIYEFIHSDLKPVSISIMFGDFTVKRARKRVFTKNIKVSQNLPSRVLILYSCLHRGGRCLVHCRSCCCCCRWWWCCSDRYRAFCYAVLRLYHNRHWMPFSWVQSVCARKQKSRLHDENFFLIFFWWWRWEKCARCVDTIAVCAL